MHRLYSWHVPGYSTDQLSLDSVCCAGHFFITPIVSRSLIPANCNWRSVLAFSREGSSTLARRQGWPSHKGLMMLYNLGFLIHIIIEIPASINFFCFPSRQLGIHTPQAHAVIRQYAVLLLVSVLLATVFVARPLDNTAGKVAGALALYHIAPFVRSVVRLHRQTQARAPIIYSEAFLYVFVHSVCFAALLHHCWTALYQKDRRNASGTLLQ